MTIDYFDINNIIGRFRCCWLIGKNDSPKRQQQCALDQHRSKEFKCREILM